MFVRPFIVCLSLLVVKSHAEDHWAYLPPVDSKPPADAAHPVDAFLVHAQKAAGLKPGKMAEPRQWLERAAFTLTGLPPSEAQISRLLANPSEEVWKSLVDELLASPAYGERWARHWMDVARYADTQGYNFDQDNRYPFAYTYRDWLIKSFNEDMPYDRFVKLQVAADLMVDRPDHPDLAALGFLTVGPRAGRVEMLDDRVDVVTRGFLSSTVSCARCHDHKTDPITTKDFYSLYSIFENADEPEDKPVIGKTANEADYQAFMIEFNKLEEADRAARQEILNQLRAPESLSIYLTLAWQAQQENWDNAKISSESFKKGRYRAKAVERWKNFLKTHATGDKANPRLADWAQQMTGSDDAGRKALSDALANEWLAAAPETDLGKLAAHKDSPLSYDLEKIVGIMDQEDGNKNRQRAGAMAKLQIEHPGTPPRAMTVKDKDKWGKAQVYVRGNPADRSEPYEREWLSFLGGGAFPEGKSPRLTLAEKIADPANPITARVIVNRVWAWHFGEAFTDAGDFGPQQSTPVLRPLLDYLALRFQEKGSSLKELHRLLLTSQAFRLEASGPVANNSIDEANNYFWKWNRRRADFESMRDRLLYTSGALDTKTVGGRSISLENATSDARRTVYAFVDRYALPGTFVSFDLPHPDLHAPKRSETTVPQQALYFLNSPLVLRQAEKLAASQEFSQLQNNDARVRWIYKHLFQREPSNAELNDAIDWISTTNPKDYLPNLAGTWEIRHTPETGGALGELQPFPLFADGAWKTGPQLGDAPIPYLHGSAEGGHTHQGHVLVARWRALGSGKVKFTGRLERPNPQGDVISWSILRPNGEPITQGELPPGKNANLDSGLIEVKAGDTIDLALRSPTGQNTCSFKWNLAVKGSEIDTDAITYDSNLKKNFPTSNSAPPAVTPASPWADLIQMLWSSNEFHYID